MVPRDKIILGVAAYGYDWSSNGTKAYGINGIAIWRLGLENADYWTSIKTKFNK